MGPRSILFAIVVAAASSVGCGPDDTSGTDEAGNIGLSVIVQNPDPTVPEAAGRACPASAGVQWNIGNPSPSSTSRGNPVGGASCFVQTDGKFHVQAHGTDSMMSPPDGSITVDLLGVAEPGAYIDAQIYTTRTLLIESSMPPCSISAVHLHEEHDLWIDFSCALLASPDSPAIGCQATGSLALAGCGD